MNNPWHSEGPLGDCYRRNTKLEPMQTITRRTRMPSSS